MRLFTLGTVALAALFSVPALAQSTESLNYNVINLQADASRKINNDQMQVSMYVEKNNKQSKLLASDINHLINQALSTARKYPTVKVETGEQSTTPVYDADNRKLKEWRGYAQIRLISQDFKATAELMAELQQNFLTESVNFSVSDSQRSKIENELMIEASQAFQKRAHLLSQAWQKSSYQIVNLNVHSNNYSVQPMPRMAMMKANMADAVPEQTIAAGESNLTVNINGSIQLK